MKSDRIIESEPLSKDWAVVSRDCLPDSRASGIFPNGQSLRIALFSWESLHSITVGGLAPHVSELAAALCWRGHDVHLFTRMGAGQSRYDCIEGVHYHRCPFDPHTHDFFEYVERMCASFVLTMKDVEATLGRNFDLIHGHDWLVTPALAWVKNELQRQVVMTVHSTEYGRCGNQMWGGPSDRVRHMEWEGAYVANRVICVSKSLREELHWLYQVPKDKITAIYNGVNVHKFDSDINVATVRERHGIGVDDPFVLFAGRLAWQKGPDLLVDAIPRILHKHPHTKFVFAGDGDMRLGLEQRVDALGASASTRFLGHRNGLDLVSLFKSADAVCVPSRNEPFGIVILEAWSARKPVVVTCNGGPAEFVQHARTGLKVSDNTESIGWGVETILGEKADARRMGRNGRHQAETRFSWDTIAAQTESVYNSVLGIPTRDELWNGNELQESESMVRKTSSNSNSKSTSRRTVKPSLREPVTAAPLTRRTPASQVGSTTRRAAPAETSKTRIITDEQIRIRAFEVYLERMRKGLPGNSGSDWAQAKRELLSR